MSKLERQISKNDNIYASLMVDGEEKLSFRRSEFSSMGDVVHLIYRLAGKFVGSARLIIRNQSQGWNIAMPLASNSVFSAFSAEKTPQVENGQYLIPW